MWPPALSLCQHRATIQIPQALLEVTIPAFLFLLFCKIIPLGSLHPLLSPTRLPGLVSQAEPACCERSPPVWGPWQPSAAGEDMLAAALVPGDPRDITTMLRWREGEGGEPSIAGDPWGWVLLVAPLLVAVSLRPRVPVGWAQLYELLIRVSVCLAVMQRSGLASAVTPRWQGALPALGTAGTRSQQSRSWENNSGEATTHPLAAFFDAAGSKVVGELQVTVGSVGLAAIPHTWERAEPQLTTSRC